MEEYPKKDEFEMNNDEDMIVNNLLVYLDGGIIDFDYVTVGHNWHTGNASGIFFGGNGVCGKSSGRSPP